MAITKTTTIERIEVISAEDSSADDTTNVAWPKAYVVYLDTIDDSSDDDLPIVHSRGKNFEKFDSEGNATVYSSEDVLVQDVLGAIWS
jgi:hypothetical protein